MFWWLQKHCICYSYLGTLFPPSIIYFPDYRFPHRCHMAPMSLGRTMTFSSTYCVPGFISSPHGRLFVSLWTLAKADFYINIENNGVFHGLFLPAYFFLNLCLTQSVSLRLTLIFYFLHLWLWKCVFLVVSVFLSSTVLDCISKDTESISRSQVSEKMNFNCPQRLWLIPSLHLGVHYVICFSCPELFLHTVGKFVPWWMLQRNMCF